MSAPYIPRLTKPSGKDTIFLSLSGQRSSSPVDDYATVPTDAERGGNFSAAGQPTIYDPANDTTCVKYGATHGQPFPGNVIPSGCIASAASRMLVGEAKLQQYFPEPNLTGSTGTSGYNYHLLTTAQSTPTGSPPPLAFQLPTTL